MPQTQSKCIETYTNYHFNTWPISEGNAQHPSCNVTRISALEVILYDSKGIKK